MFKSKPWHENNIIKSEARMMVLEIDHFIKVLERHAVHYHSDRRVYPLLHSVKDFKHTIQKFLSKYKVESDD